MNEELRRQLSAAFVKATAAFQAAHQAQQSAALAVQHASEAQDMLYALLAETAPTRDERATGWQVELTRPPQSVEDIHVCPACGNDTWLFLNGRDECGQCGAEYHDEDIHRGDR